MLYRSSNKTVYSAKYHIIWCPKYRRRVLVGQVEMLLKEIIAEVVADLSGNVIEVEVMSDHVGLLVEFPPAVVLSKALQLIKGRSSRSISRPQSSHLNPDRARQNPAGLLSGRGDDGNKTKVPTGSKAA